MTLELPYLLLDVFTDRPLAGNALAVVLDENELASDALMQAVARELNLSETVFLRPARRPDCTAAARIFTPTRELPFAGHPTVGAAVALHELGRVETSEGRGRVVLEEGVGSVGVDLRIADGNAPHGTLEAAEAPERLGDGLDRGAVARILGLPPDAVEADAGVWSCGVAFQVVPLAERGALGRCRLDRGAWHAAVGGREGGGLADLAGLAILAPESIDDDGERSLRARVFAPGAGVDEDPATGSAAVAAVGWLARDAADGRIAWTIEQGLEMGRPSRLDAAADVASGRAVRARVGGHAVVVGRGVLHLPD